MKAKEFIKKRAWVFLMAFLSNGIAFKYWSSYFTGGSVYDGRHGITFFGSAASGHLLFATLMAIVFSSYAIKSAVELYHES
jgi:hypothetical protein